MENKGRIINFRPLVFVGLILIIGILISSLTIFYNSTYTIILFCLLFLSFIWLSFYLLKSKNYKTFITVCVSLLVLLVGVFSFFNVKAIADNSNYSSDAFISGYVVEVKENNSNGYQIVVEGELDGKLNKILLNVSAEFNVYVGSKVEFNGDIYKIDYNSNDVNLYPLINNQYFAATNINNFKVYAEFNSVSSRLKYIIISRLKSYMPNGYGFSYALLVGDTSYLSSDSLSGFRYTGVAHIFAVSGLHVGFLYAFLSLIFKFLKVKSKTSSFIILFLIFLYVWFCGFSASCLRAFIIISINLLSKILDFKYDKISALFLSAIIVLFINPFYLFDLGFLLSYFAYSSIVLLTKPTTKFFERFLPSKVAVYLAPYFAVYLGILPISLTSFGYYSAFSMFFNMIIVPIISIVFILNLFAVFGLLITPYLSFLCVLPELCFILITKFITSINYFAFLLTDINLGISAIFYYMMLVFMLEEINISKKIRKNILLSLLFVFIVSVFVINLGN